jgi:hypothetical protein
MVVISGVQKRSTGISICTCQHVRDKEKWAAKEKPPTATLIGSSWPPPKVSKPLAKAISPSYASPSPSLQLHQHNVTQVQEHVKNSFIS